jgi:hypothetical protein
MRPWAICKELDDAVEQELERGNEILNLTSPVKNAGYPGSSELDMKPPELIDFNSMLENPAWMGFDEPEVNEADIKDLNSSEIDDETSLSEHSFLLDDPTIAAAIKKVNALTVNFNRSRLQMARLKTMRLLPIDTMIRVSHKHNKYYFSLLSRASNNHRFSVLCSFLLFN